LRAAEDRHLGKVVLDRGKGAFPRPQAGDFRPYGGKFVGECKLGRCHAKAPVFDRHIIDSISQGIAKG
jgi:hypothetical protein